MATATAQQAVSLRRAYVDENMTVAHRLKKCSPGVMLIDKPGKVDSALLCPDCGNGKHKEVRK